MRPTVVAASQHVFFDSDAVGLRVESADWADLAPGCVIPTIEMSVEMAAKEVVYPLYWQTIQKSELPEPGKMNMYVEQFETRLLQLIAIRRSNLTRTVIDISLQMAWINKRPTTSITAQVTP